ncbi:MAG TPA: sugar ABC transporter ATP-binding protein [Candidatus Eisenbacteria bacterium]|nr:sugar ABC transporter ATP-binding protein [Candidatus Eisenbacteria bacterium]
MIKEINTNTPLVELKNCSKYFPATVALDDVSFTLKPGECHALVGENGAGKSTLAKCITGEYSMSKGTLYVNGEKINEKEYNVRVAQSKQIGIVHQEFQLMDEMTGMENIFVGHYPQKGPFVDWQKLNKKAKELFEFLESDVDYTIPVHRLRTADKQIIQLARALALNAKTIIFDELTAVLPEADIENVYRIIRLLKSRGIGIIYISHRLDEIFDVCDRYTVLTDGKHIESGDVSDINKNRLIQLISGKELTKAYPTVAESKEEQVLLELDNVSGDGFKNINMTIHKGEIVGIAGLVGAGKTELLHAIFGDHTITEGKIRIEGKEVNINSPKQAIKNGFGLIPDERRRLGLNHVFNVCRNATLASLDKYQPKIFMEQKREFQDTEKVMDQLNLKYSSLKQRINTLSGGNQQKVVIGKWIIAGTEIYLMDEPTRGIDVGSKYEIYTLIQELVEQGKSILLVSPELEELMGLCHTIYVMYEGEVKFRTERENFSHNEIMSYLLGSA